MKRTFTILSMMFCMLISEQLLAQCAPEGRGNNNGNRYLLDNYTSTAARDAAIAQISSIVVGGTTYSAEAHPTIGDRIRTTPLQPNGTFANPFTGSITINLVGGGTVTCVYNANTLPVELTTFEANAGDSGVDLFWETASETDNDGFEVQRSINGLDFEAISWVPGSGTTERASTYQFSDASAISGQHFYRLKQMDLDGTASFSSIVVVELSGAGRVNVYPNPVSKGNDLTVIGSNSDTFTIYNEMGIAVRRNSNTNTVETGALASGFYFVVFQDGARAKFVVQ